MKKSVFLNFFHFWKTYFLFYTCLTAFLLNTVNAVGGNEHLAIFDTTLLTCPLQGFQETVKTCLIDFSQKNEESSNYPPIPLSEKIYGTLTFYTHKSLKETLTDLAQDNMHVAQDNHQYPLLYGAHYHGWTLFFTPESYISSFIKARSPSISHVSSFHLEHLKELTKSKEDLTPFFPEIMYWMMRCYNDLKTLQESEKHLLFYKEKSPENEKKDQLLYKKEAIKQNLNNLSSIPPQDREVWAVPYVINDLSRNFRDDRHNASTPLSPPPPYEEAMGRIAENQSMEPEESTQGPGINISIDTESIRQRSGSFNKINVSITSRSNHSTPTPPPYPRPTTYLSPLSPPPRTLSCPSHLDLKLNLELKAQGCVHQSHVNSPSSPFYQPQRSPLD